MHLCLDSSSLLQPWASGLRQVPSFPSQGLSLLICKMGLLSLATLDCRGMMDAKQWSSPCLLPQHCPTPIHQRSPTSSSPFLAKLWAPGKGRGLCSEGAQKNPWAHPAPTVHPLFPQLLLSVPDKVGHGKEH